MFDLDRSLLETHEERACLTFYRTPSLDLGCQYFWLLFLNTLPMLLTADIHCDFRKLWRLPKTSFPKGHGQQPFPGSKTSPYCLGSKPTACEQFIRYSSSVRVLTRAASCSKIIEGSTGEGQQRVACRRLGWTLRGRPSWSASFHGLQTIGVLVPLRRCQACSVPSSFHVNISTEINMCIIMTEEVVVAANSMSAKIKALLSLENLQGGLLHVLCPFSRPTLKP